MTEHPATRAFNKYLNKKVSLLSTSAVRYVGELFTIEPNEPSISLKNVQCLGTEDRRSGPQAIAASNVIYEFIRFRASNIKSLHLEKNNQMIDLTKEILQPLRQHSESSHDQPETRSSSIQQQSSSNKNDKQRNKPSIVSDEPKRKVGVPQQSDYGVSYDYYSSQRSPQYGSSNQYEHGVDAYPPIPSPHQTVQEGIYPQPYPYDNEANYLQNVNFSQAGPQTQSSYYSREHNAPMIPTHEEYYQQSPTSYGFTMPHSPAQNIPMINQLSQGYDRPLNYNNYPQYQGNYYQPNANRPRYSNDPRRQQRSYRGGYGGNQNNQRYYNANQRQGPSGSANRQRYDSNRGGNQAPGTGAYLDRRLKGDDLEIATTDFNFASLNVSEKPTDNKKTDSNDKTISNEEKKQSSTSTGNEDIKKEDTHSGNKTTNEDTTGNGKENQVNNENETKQKEVANASSNEQNATTSGDDKTRKPAYDKNKSFFDSITTDADIKKQQKQVNLEEQRYNDAETFGTVAETYRSRHVLNPQNNDNNRRNNANYQRNFNPQQRRNNPQQKFYNNYRPRYVSDQQQYVANYHRPNFIPNNDNANFDYQQRWVQKRVN